MSERKKRLKNHIKEAREWLCKAEDSLNKDNNIQGDLNLMLAQAELQRAKEFNQSQNKKKTHWVARLTPVAVAMLLVFIGSQVWQDVFATKVYSPPLKTVVEEHIPKPAVIAPGSESSPVNTPSAQQHTIAAEVMGPAVEKEKPVQIIPTKEENIVVTRTERLAEPKIPSEDMQKLMRAAGKTLRAQ